MIRKSLFAANFAKLFGAATVAATMCMAPSAHAGVLDFEGYADNFVTDGAGVQVGDYYLQTAGGGYALIGNIDSCTSDIACPANNATTYYISGADSYTFLQMADASLFKLASIDTSFLGFTDQSYPAVSGFLQVAAFSATNVLLGQVELALDGPFGGTFDFSTYDMTALGGGADYSYVRFASFACAVNATSCNRNGNQAQFALDNVVTVNASDVPEPGSFALMGLGLFGIGAAARRRKAAAAV
jgi:hypothetical protein